MDRGVGKGGRWRRWAGGGSADDGSTPMGEKSTGGDAFVMPASTWRPTEVLCFDPSADGA